MTVNSSHCGCSPRANVGVRSLCCLVALVLLITAIGCGRRQAEIRPNPPPDAEDMKELIGYLAKKKKVGMINDMRIPSAKRLGEAGPAAAEAIPALEKMANDKDPVVKEAALEALKKIKGG